MTRRPVIVFLDHDRHSVAEILDQLARRTAAERTERFDELFRFEQIVLKVPVIAGIAEQDRIATEARQIADQAIPQIDAQAADAVLVDLSYDTEGGAGGDAVSRGIAIAAELQRRLPQVRVGIYSTQGVNESDEEDIILSLERFAIVLVNLQRRLRDRRFDPGGTRWLEILNRLVQSSPTPPSPQPRHALFISHAHADVVLAGAVKDLICAALNLGIDRVCATAVAPELAPGQLIADKLAELVAGASIVLVLITEKSSAAPYVWFEVGVAHASASSRPSIVAAFSDSGKELVEGTPLRAQFAVNLTDRKDLDHMITTVAELLGMQVMRAKYYADHIEHLIAAAKSL